jgi:hypothetical protein
MMGGEEQNQTAHKTAAPRAAPRPPPPRVQTTRSVTAYDFNNSCAGR